MTSLYLTLAEGMDTTLRCHANPVINDLGRLRGEGHAADEKDPMSPDTLVE